MLGLWARVKDRGGWTDEAKRIGLAIARGRQPGQAHQGESITDGGLTTVYDVLDRGAYTYKQMDGAHITYTEPDSDRVRGLFVPKAEIPYLIAALAQCLAELREPST